MSNRYYGDFGDIWKHIPLAEVLQTEDIGAYWESHSGSARYNLELTDERAYGIETFYRRLPQSAELSASTYAALLPDFTDGAGALVACPGSPWVAMSGLAGRDVNFHFADIDGESLQSIAEAAAGLGITERVEVEHRDGPSTLARLAGEASPESLRRTVALIDPYRPFEAESLGLTDTAAWESSGSGRTPIEVFGALAALRVMAILWYGFGPPDEREFCRTEINRVLTVIPAEAVWWGELALAGGCETTAGFQLQGCGLVCTNLSEISMRSLLRIGEAIADLYRGDAVASLDFEVLAPGT